MKCTAFVRPLLVVVLVWGVAGCGGGSGAEAAASTAEEVVAVATETASSSPTPTPSPTPTVWTTEEAGARYLVLVAPANAAGQVLNDALAAWDASPDDTALFEAAKARQGEYAAAARAFADGLVVGLWPETVKPTVDLLVMDLAGEIAQSTSLAAATTVDEFYAAASSYQAPATNYGQQIRILLGLPNVQG